MFAGPFSLEGAVAVAGEEDEQADRVVDALEQLVAKSLVSARPEGSSTRYRLLDTTRAYAMRKLADGGDAKPVARQHAQYIQHALEKTMVEFGQWRSGVPFAGAERLARRCPRSTDMGLRGR